MKNIVSILLALVFCLSMAFVTGCGNSEKIDPVEQQKIDSKTELRLMSYNIQHCAYYYGGNVEYDKFQNVLNDTGADIVGMNEVRNGGKTQEFGNQTDILGKACGYIFRNFGRAISREECDYGNAILSKVTIDSVEVIPVVVTPKNPLYEDRCLIKAKLKNGLTVLVTHFGCETDEEIKKGVEEVMENITDKKCVLMGDLNVKPDDKNLDPIKEKMTDTADFFTEELLIWPAGDPDRRLDYIFVSKDITVVKSDIPKVLCSDHRPYIVDIKF